MNNEEASKTYDYNSQGAKVYDECNYYNSSEYR